MTREYEEKFEKLLTHFSPFPQFVDSLDLVYFYIRRRMIAGSFITSRMVQEIFCRTERMTRKTGKKLWLRWNAGRKKAKKINKEMELSLHEEKDPTFSQIMNCKLFTGVV